MLQLYTQGRIDSTHVLDPPPTSPRMSGRVALVRREAGTRSNTILAIQFACQTKLISEKSQIAADFPA